MYIMYKYICEKEANRFDYQAKRGVTLEFSKSVETREIKV